MFGGTKSPISFTFSAKTRINGDKLMKNSDLRHIWLKNRNTPFMITRKTLKYEKHPIWGIYGVSSRCQPEPLTPFQIISIPPSSCNPDILVMTNDMKNAYSSVIELGCCTYCGAPIESNICTNCGCELEMEIKQ